MPENKLKEFIARLTSLESKMDKHLEEGVLVHRAIAELKTSSMWMRYAFWVLVLLGTAITGSLVTALFNHLWR